MTFCFRRGPHEHDYTADNNIFVHHPKVVHHQNLPVKPSILGHTIKHSLEICIRQTGVYDGLGYIEDISYRALRQWLLELPGDPRNVKVQFDYDHDAEEIRVDGAGCDIPAISTKEREN